MPTTPATTTTTTAPAQPLPQTHHYVRLSITGSTSTSNNSATDALQIRRALQDALAQSFGTVLSHAYLDVLWVEEVDASSGTGTGTECVVRTNGPSDAAKVMAAIAVADGTLRLSAIKESPFLPSVSVSGGGSRTIF